MRARAAVHVHSACVGAGAALLAVALVGCKGKAAGAEAGAGAAQVEAQVVAPVVVGGHRADLRVRVCYGYVYGVAVFRDLTPAEAAEAAEAERLQAEAEDAKRAAARAKRAASRNRRLPPSGVTP